MPRTDQAVTGITLHPSGTMRPMYKPRGNGIRDIRESGEFFLSVQEVWRERGNEILHRVADNYPEQFLLV